MPKSVAKLGKLVVMVDMDVSIDVLTLLKSPIDVSLGRVRLSKISTMFVTNIKPSHILLFVMARVAAGANNMSG